MPHLDTNAITHTIVLFPQSFVSKLHHFCLAQLFMALNVDVLTFLTPNFNMHGNEIISLSALSDDDNLYGYECSQQMHHQYFIFKSLSILVLAHVSPKCVPS
ncbi:hypothetical protein ABKN59_010410 [Abortiporus biennis]